MRTLIVLLFTMAPFGLFAQAPTTNLDFELAGQIGVQPLGWAAFSSPAGVAFQATLVSGGCLQRMFTLTI
jgi:hypothetical protein